MLASTMPSNDLAVLKSALSKMPAPPLSAFDDIEVTLAQRESDAVAKVIDDFCREPAEPDGRGGKQHNPAQAVALGGRNRLLAGKVSGLELAQIRLLVEAEIKKLGG
jgi:hypothetical protein